MVGDQMTEGFGGGWWSWLFFKKYNPFGSVKAITICYGLFALLLAFLAVLTAAIYTPLQEYEVQYANENGCLTNSIDPTKNHTSVSDRCECIGNLIDLETAQSQCRPFLLNKDMGKTVSWSGKKLDPDAIASPCGFKAFLYFNDTFKLKKIENKQIADIKIDETQVTKNQGIGIKYKSRNPDEEWINPTDEHFMNWMQNQALMTKQKLWGRINYPLEPGNYSLIVQNRYKIHTMRLAKGVRIMESSSMGGKEYIFPILFGVFALGCGLYAIIFHRNFKSLDQKMRDE